MGLLDIFVRELLMVFFYFDFLNLNYIYETTDGKNICFW